MATINRKELYKKVWETPITRLSKEYGLSDVGFAKIQTFKFLIQKKAGPLLTSRSLKVLKDPCNSLIYNRKQAKAINKICFWKSCLLLHIKIHSSYNCSRVKGENATVLSFPYFFKRPIFIANKYYRMGKIRSPKNF
jgi:hypothetical protein